MERGEAYSVGNERCERMLCFSLFWGGKKDAGEGGGEGMDGNRCWEATLLLNLLLLLKLCSDERALGENEEDCNEKRPLESISVSYALSDPEVGNCLC